MTHGGYFETLSGAPMDPNFVKHFFSHRTFRCGQDEGLWGQDLGVLGPNRGLWSQNRRIGSHRSKFFKVILTHGGYFEALSGAPEDPNFG